MNNEIKLITLPTVTSDLLTQNDEITDKDALSYRPLNNLSVKLEHGYDDIINAKVAANVFTNISRIHVDAAGDKLCMDDVTDITMRSPRYNLQLNIDRSDANLSNKPLPRNNIFGQPIARKGMLVQQAQSQQNQRSVAIFRDGTTIPIPDNKENNVSCIATEYDTSVKIKAFPQRKLPWLTKEKLAQTKGSRLNHVRLPLDRFEIKGDHVNSVATSATERHRTSDDKERKNNSPSPATYNISDNLVTHPKSPSWTIGKRTFIEKKGGSRTSWEKSWFQGNVWTHKTDFYQEHKWPSPADRNTHVALGRRHPSSLSSPSFSLGQRAHTDMPIASKELIPSPDTYATMKAVDNVKPVSPQHTMGYHRPRTPFWITKEKTPGPGAYAPKIASIRRHAPVFSVKCHRYGNVIDGTGPFAVY